MTTRTSASRPLFLVGVTILVLAGGGFCWWWFTQRLPEQGSSRYEEFTEAFYVGTAALDVGELTGVGEPLERAVKLVPDEPAARVNRGLFYLRTGQFDKAGRDLKRADQLAPDNQVILFNLAILADKQGKPSEAVTLLRRALKHDPKNAVLLWQLALMLKTEAKAENEAERLALMDEILVVHPDNLPGLCEKLVLAAHISDAKAFREAVQRLRGLSKNWQLKTEEDTVAAQGILKAIETKDGQPLGADTFIQATQLTNILRSGVTHKRELNMVDPGREKSSGMTMQSFLRLKPPRSSPSPPDLALTYKEEMLTGPPAANITLTEWDVAFPVWLVDDKCNPAVFVANAKEVRRVDAASQALPFPAGSKNVAPTTDGLLTIDWNNDFLTDLLLAGAGGLKFYQQQLDGSFKDVTATTKLPTEILQGDYYGAWAADLDMDGDLDIILAPRKGPLIVLRNNGDGTFKQLQLFPDVAEVRGFVWADLDNDGAPDAVFLDTNGKLHLYANDRMMRFSRWPGPELPAPAQAIAPMDVTDDGTFDLIVLLEDGRLIGLVDKDKRQGWDTRELGSLPENTLAGVVPGAIRLDVNDMDNNGSLDVAVLGLVNTYIWLTDAAGKFHLMPVIEKSGYAFAAVDLNEDGTLDLLALDSQNRRPTRLIGVGAKGYHWECVRFQATKKLHVEGDQRINSFGIGGDIEARTGTFVVKVPINRPAIHLGLGERRRADIVRITWPNGMMQMEFNPKPDATVAPVQRLSGSCPFLYTWDGQRMVFVADFLWSSPLGMYINAQDKGGFLQTTDWVRIGGNQLGERNGLYDVRVQANLRETHYIDHLALMVIDHPPGTEMFVDERFFLTPTKPQFYLTTTPKPVARAWDHLGKDATDELRAIDGKYLDRAGRGLFQGVSNDHWVEFDLGDDAPTTGPVYLLANGFIHPTDSSINYAIEQGEHMRPRGLELEVPDGKGGWKVGRPLLGFPAGKNKTVVIRLDGIDGPGVARRGRLRTNMEIFWDYLGYASGADASTCKQQVLQPKTADLRYRGVVRMTQADVSSPELPHYDQIDSIGQPWRDLIGYHTRFGDVRELLEKIDDRYVIMNSGDEIALTFEPPPPVAHAPGSEPWKRDFVWISDGWVKDGNPNTRFGKTVLPLPYHDMKSYDQPPGRLEDDPVYRRFPRDWQVFHTRYITPSQFERGLRPLRSLTLPARHADGPRKD